MKKNTCLKYLGFSMHSDFKMESILVDALYRKGKIELIVMFFASIDLDWTWPETHGEGTFNYYVDQTLPNFVSLFVKEATQFCITAGSTLI